MTPKQQDQAWVESQRVKYREASAGAYALQSLVEDAAVDVSDDAVRYTVRLTPVRDENGNAIDTRAHGDPATIADLIDVVRELIGAINTQREGIQALAESVGALAQCVAMVMEEELGTPVADEPAPVETDWDGNPVA